MKLYAARHGQTQWNMENKVCGRTDQPLTETGHAQAQLLADLPLEDPYAYTELVCRLMR